MFVHSSRGWEGREGMSQDVQAAQAQGEEPLFGEEGRLGREAGAVQAAQVRGRIAEAEAEQEK